MTKELESIFPFHQYEGSILTQDAIIRLLLHEMRLNKHIRYDTVLLTPDFLAVHPDAELNYDYLLRITVDGLEYINKVKDRTRWIWTTIIAIAALATSIFSIVFVNWHTISKAWGI